MTDPRTDRELLVASRVETGAFEELYRRHVGATIRFAARRAERPSDVVDLVAAVWLEVVASVDRYEPQRGDALPWILGIAANLCAVERRRRAREHEVFRRLGGRRALEENDYERLEGEIDAAGVAPALRQGLQELLRRSGRSPNSSSSTVSRLMVMTVDEREPMLFEQDVLEIALESLRSRRESGLLQAPHRRRRPRRRTVIAIAATGLAIAIAVPIALPGGVTGGADPAAAAVLNRVALRAAKQPPEPAPGPGQYLYTRSEIFSTALYVVGDGTTFLFRNSGVNESWIGPDGSGRGIAGSDKATFPTERDRATWIAAGSPDLYDERTEDDRYGPGELAYRSYADLPTDPERLLDLIESRELIGGPNGDWETFAIIGDLLRGTYTQPKVRAALYQVAAELPGVELVGRVMDGSGRPGVAVAYTRTNTDAPSRHELIFDPTTAELLGENEVLVAQSTVDVESGGPGAIYGGVGPAGTLAYSTTYLVSGVVDSTTESL